MDSLYILDVFHFRGDFNAHALLHLLHFRHTHELMSLKAMGCYKLPSSTGENEAEIRSKRRETHVKVEQINFRI